MAWVRVSSHGKLQEVLPEAKSPAFSGAGDEGLANTAPGRNVSFPQVVEATLVVVTE